LPAPGDPAAIFTPRQFSSGSDPHAAVVTPPRFLALPAIESPRYQRIVSTAGSSAAGSACSDGSQKKDGHQWHHLATNKNEISSTQGGPWTPLFQRIFAKAGMDLDDPANRVYLAGHQGPHPEAYHEVIYDTLRRALARCNSVEHCRSTLTTALQDLAQEVCTPGSRLHQLVTKAQQ
jgi:HNH/ENDO VII superfamily nuclease